MTDISIIIVSWNVKEYLRGCLSSVFKNIQGISVEVIVVDNNSSDGSVEMLKQNYPDVKLIGNRNNNGFSKANNQGIEIAQSENILLLNPDTEIKYESLEKMISFLDSQKSCCIVAPKLLNTDGTLQMSCLKFPNLFMIIAEVFYLHHFFDSKKYLTKKMKSVFETDALSGAALLFKKDTINKIGMLDENLFWVEDVDFCYRNKISGGVNIYFPEAEIIHHSGQSSKKNYRITISNQLISRLKFFRKHKKYFSFFF